jgi:class 3 adenylate cyclase
MPSKCLLINPSDPELRNKVEALQRVPGICIFIDITGSTQMKCSTIKEWIAKIYNCFHVNSSLFLSPFTPIKSIGDALMYYIEETDLLASGYNALQIYDGLWQLATESDPNFPEVKIGAAWCEAVYPITFFAGNRDYYGIDIDLTSRLQKIAETREVVMDFRLHERVMMGYEASQKGDDFVSVRRLVGPERVSLKGIPQKNLIYRGL